MRLPGRPRPVRVYVDAKILNMHDPTLPREAYVGYVMEGKKKSRVKRIEASESDDAEILAILFAIDDLKGELGKFTILCDHESVVSEARKESVRKPSQLMKTLRETLKLNPSIRLEALQANLAHQAVTEFVNSLKTDSKAWHAFDPDRRGKARF